MQRLLGLLSKCFFLVTYFGYRPKLTKTEKKTNGTKLNEPGGC